jgi:hypothetical protein
VPKRVDTDAASPSARAPEGAVTADDLTSDQDVAGTTATGEQTPGTASAQRAQDPPVPGETSNEDIEMPPAGDPEPVEGVPALGDPDAPVDDDTNTLTAKDNPLETDAGGDTSKAERPLEIPAVDKADLAEQRADNADTELRQRQAANEAATSDPASRSTDTEDAEAATFTSDRPERRGAADTSYAGPERRRTVDSTHGLGAGQPVARRGGRHGDLVLDHHGRPMVAGSTYTATYEYEDETDVAPGAGETGLIFELNTPRGRRVLPVVRTGAAGTVSVTFPVEFEGPYRARLIDGSSVLATLDFTV